MIIIIVIIMARLRLWLWLHWVSMHLYLYYIIIVTLGCTRPHALLIIQKNWIFSIFLSPQHQPCDHQRSVSKVRNNMPIGVFGDSALHSAWFDHLPRWRKSLVHAPDYMFTKLSSRKCSGRSKAKMKPPFRSYRQRFVSMRERSFHWWPKSLRYWVNKQSDIWKIKS